jgi:hypothetical protein
MTEIPWMDTMWQEIFASALCVLIALGAVAAAAWSLISGRASEQGMDGLFLIIICLVFAALFSIIPAMSLRSGALAQLMKGNKPEAAPAAADKSQGQK